MVRKKQWHVKDKWKRHLALVKHQKLLKYIPPTRLLTKNNIKYFLHRYKTVFVKPVYGSNGNNILKVTRRKKSYLLHYENETRKIPKNNIIGTLSRKYQGQRYMIQEGISLLKLRGRPIDFRMLLLKPNKDWIMMGVMGKMAKRKNIVTNFSHGGKPIRLTKALIKAGWSQNEIVYMQNRINRLGILVAHKFNQKYKHCRKIGIDIALDTNKKIWIIEVNTAPAFELFKYHKNKQLYEKIGKHMKTIENL